jgi:hypothetical protein
MLPGALVAPVPRPLELVTRAGICGSDLHIWRGEMISEAFRQADWLSHEGDPLRISRAAIAC